VKQVCGEEKHCLVDRVDLHSIRSFEDKEIKQDTMVMDRHECLVKILLYDLGVADLNTLKLLLQTC